MIEYLKKKKNVLIVLLIAVVIVGVAVLITVLITGSKDEKPNHEEKENEIKNTLEKLEDGKVTVTNFLVNYNQNDKRWYLSMSVENTSDKEIDLQDYSLKLYHDNKLLVVIAGTALGKVPAKTEIGSVITLNDDYKDVNYVEITKE